MYFERIIIIYFNAIYYIYFTQLNSVIEIRLFLETTLFYFFFFFKNKINKYIKKNLSNLRATSLQKILSYIDI